MLGAQDADSQKSLTRSNLRPPRIGGVHNTCYEEEGGQGDKIWQWDIVPKCWAQDVP